VVCGGAGALDLRPDFASLTLDEQLTLVRVAWECELPRLLIFDGCEDEQLFDSLRPRAGAARVLVTARRENWDTSFSAVHFPVGSLNTDEAIELLRMHRPDIHETDSAVDDLLIEIGGLALAVELSGRYLARYSHMSVTAYLADLRSKSLLVHPALNEPRGVSPTGYERGLAATLAVSWDRLDLKTHIDTDAVDLLSHGACLAPGTPIPRALLYTVAAVNDEMRFADALRRLADLGFVQGPARAFVTIHAAVAAFARRRSAPPRTVLEVETGLLEYSGRIGPDTRAAVALLLPHLQTLAAGPFARTDAAAAAYMRTMGLFLWRAGELERAEGAQKRAVAIAERVFGENAPEVASALNDLGVVLENQRRSEDSLTCHERALAIQQRLGLHQAVALSIYNIAAVRQNRGDPAMREWLDAAVAAAEQLAQIDPAGLVRALDRRSLAWGVARGEFARFEADAARAVEIINRDPAIPPKDSVGPLNSLGVVHLTLGDANAALSLFERAYESAVLAYGEQHKQVGTTLANVGVARRELGDFDGAAEALGSALEVLVRTLGAQHLGVVSTLLNIGLLASRTGDTGRARDLLQQHVARVDAQLSPVLAVRVLSELSLLESDPTTARSFAARAAARIATMPPEFAVRRLVEDRMRAFELRPTRISSP